MEKVNTPDEILAQEFLSLTNADAFTWLKEKSKPYIALMSYYRCAMMEIETKFKVLSEEHSLQHDRTPISAIKTRLKRLDSIHEKLGRQGFPKTLESMEENLNDIAGVRVICSFPADVYMLEETFLRQDDITLLRRKDYIANPKANGYRSLHLIVSIPIYLANGKREMKVEVQLRTIAMDMWASLEHELRYKSDRNFSDSDAARLRLCSEAIGEIDREMQRIYLGEKPEYEA